MSSRGNKRPPEPWGRYYTPDWLAHAIVSQIAYPYAQNIMPPYLAPSILEPNAGRGAFVRAARHVWPQAEIVALDRHSEVWELEGRKLTTGHVDSYRLGPEPAGLDMTIGNPPFERASETAELGLIHSRVTILLLRLAFLCSMRRAPWWRRFRPSQVWLIPKRPGFSVPESYEREHGKMRGGDSADYAAFVWDAAKLRGQHVETRLYWLDCGRIR